MKDRRKEKEIKLISDFKKSLYVTQIWSIDTHELTGNIAEQSDFIWINLI